MFICYIAVDEDMSQSPLYQKKKDDPRVASLMWHDRYDDTDEDDDPNSSSTNEFSSDDNDGEHDDNEDQYMDNIFNWYEFVILHYQKLLTSHHLQDSETFLRVYLNLSENKVTNSHNDKLHGTRNINEVQRSFF